MRSLCMSERLELCCSIGNAGTGRWRFRLKDRLSVEFLHVLVETYMS
jgi:hypothetical protein